MITFASASTFGSASPIASESEHGNEELFERLEGTKSARIFKRAFFHDLSVPEISGHVWVDPSDRPSIVKITSRVRPATPAIQARKQDLASPEYFAAIRRRIVVSLIPLVEGLREFEASENLVVATHPITTELRSALKVLEDSQTEGNSRAIIRQLRDCLLNSGWEQMRDAAKRSAVLRVLRLLTKDGEVTPLDVDGSFDMLLDSGLTPVALPAFDFGE